MCRDSLEAHFGRYSPLVDIWIPVYIPYDGNQGLWFSPYRLGQEGLK